MGSCLMIMHGLSSNVRIAHIAFYWKFFRLNYIQVLCQYRHCKAEHAYLTYLILQRQLSHLNGRKLCHRQVEASYIFYVWLRLVLYCEHAHSHDFVRLLLIACAILYTYNTDGWKPCVNRGPVCTLVRRTLFCRRCNFKWCVSATLRRGKHKSLLIWAEPYVGLV
jgi:hypothetical protein